MPDLQRHWQGVCGREVQTVKLTDLQDYVWRRAPLGKHIIGRRVFADLVQLTVESWEPMNLNHATSDDATAAVCGSIERSVKRMHQVLSGKEPQEYGIFWAFILQLMVSVIIKIMLEWWQERASNRVWLVTMQSELTK
jgi:hypothetical protein